MARNRNVMLYERAEHFDKADALTKAAVERGRDLTAEEKKQLQAHMDAMEKIDAEISRLDAGFPANGYRPTPVVMPGAQANDPTKGRIFAKGESTVLTSTERTACVNPELVSAMGAQMDALAAKGGTR